MSVLLYPPYLQWEVVSECNHKCIHCYNYWRADNLDVVKHSDFNAITEQIILRKPVYVAITGGEPLLVFEQIKPCISKMIEAGIRISISSNGILVTEEIAEFYERNNIDTVISFPSINSAVCDAICNSNNVAAKLQSRLEILKRHKIPVTINIVLTKLNLPTLYETLSAVKEWGFTARVGIAQRPINASEEYIKYELDREDFRNIIKECIRAKRELMLDVDFSVCVPDCAFDSEEEYLEIDKGDCYAGSIAYSIGTGGEVKACQCDIKTYGNILRDNFEDIYARMSEWRNGGMIPQECQDCNRAYICRGGCRVEAFAYEGNRKKLPTFANLKNIPVNYHKQIEIINFTDNSIFNLSPEAKFLKDKDCYRVSVGITAAHLTNEFAEWLQANPSFKFNELQKISDIEIEREELTLILNMLIKNRIIILKH
ncbi:MAG: radical SAM protein [Synergistaceae bacterium]|nr:radical SAM protein [Synergistaceae bacterium]